MLSRRNVVAGLSLAAPALSSLRAAEDRHVDLRRRLSDLEAGYGGRLGVAIRDTTGAAIVAWRGDERFPLCSTYKLLAAAFVLARVDRGQDSLSRRLPYARDALVSYSPVTEKHAGDGMTLGDLCDAAVTLSDNTAGNLLLDSFGGPAALTRHLRSLGDAVTRLDRREPELNDVRPGDPRDTTAPAAMLATLDAVVLGSALSARSRAQLQAWLIGCKTGDRRLRAGVPTGWRAGDKTGSGPRNATNDVAVLWPPGRAPILVTAFYVDARGSDDERSAVLAEVGRLAATA